MAGEPKRYEIGKGGVKCAVGAPAVVELPPRVFRLRLRRALFDIDKTFLRPESLHSIKLLCRFYKKYKALNVLINGHTDSDAPADYNLGLSKERAQAMADYLQDKVDNWYAWYGLDKPWNKRWATREDQHMLWHLRDKEGKRFLDHEANSALDGATRKAIERFQDERGLSPKIKGAIDEPTRKELIRSYMAEDETTLPGEATLSFHGCGEYNLEVQTGDGVSEARNRRVEVFLFEDKVEPKVVEPCAKAGCPYHQWKKQAVLTVDLDKDPGSLRVKVFSGGKAIEGVTVVASGPETFQTETGPGDAGAFFPLLLAGSYTLKASKPGFKSLSDGNTITVSEGGETGDVMMMQALSRLRVKVRRPSQPDQGLGGAKVTVRGPIDPDGPAEQHPPEREATSEEKTGLVTFDDLELGIYEIRAAKPPLQFDKPVTVKVGPNGANTSVELYEEVKLKVVTYNVQLMVFPGPNAFNELRVPLIAQKIDKDADAITFDELFHESAQVQLFQLLHKDYPSQSTVVDEEDTDSDGGVAIIVHAGLGWEDGGHIIYRSSAGADGWSNKGVKHVWLEKQGHKFHLFASHTQADYLDESDGLHPDVRVKQFDQLREFQLSKNIPADEPILICGDLNVPWQQGQGKELNDMLKQLNCKFPDKQTGSSYTNDEEVNDVAREAAERRNPVQKFKNYYDYILPCQDSLMPVESSVETVKFRSDKPYRIGETGIEHYDLSDHYAVRGLYVYRF